MPPSEADTRAKLIDPALHARGWTEDLIRREETAGAVEIVEVHSHKRTDFTSWVKVNLESQVAEINRLYASLLGETFAGQG
jgi:type I restriction enzyme, R subunit